MSAAPQQVSRQRSPPVVLSPDQEEREKLQQAEHAAIETQSAQERRSDELEAARVELEKLEQHERDAVHRAEHAKGSAASQKNPAVKRRLEQIAKDHGAAAKEATAAREAGAAKVSEAETALGDAKAAAEEAKATAERRAERLAARLAAEEAAAARAAEKAALEREQRERQAEENAEEADNNGRSRSGSGKGGHGGGSSQGGGGGGGGGNSSSSSALDPYASSPASRPALVLTQERILAGDSPSPMMTGGSLDLSSEADASSPQERSGVDGVASSSAATKRGDFFTSYLSPTERENKKAPWLAQLAAGNGTTQKQPKPWPENRPPTVPGVTGRLLAATESRKARGTAAPVAVAADPFARKGGKSKKKKGSTPGGKSKKKAVRV